MKASERLKNIREDLVKTQKEMAAMLGIAPRTWQNYEEGIHDPSWKVIEGLVKMGFNANWILTGEGKMNTGTSCGWWSDKIKEIRGNLTIPEFVKQLQVRNPENMIATIKAIEDKRMDADFSLMNVLNCQLGISVDWMFGVSGVPKLISERDSGFVQTALLKDIIKEAELYESINPGSLSLDKKAELMAELYAMRAAKGQK